jgi:large subunit ribosomal protein L10
MLPAATILPLGPYEPGFRASGGPYEENGMDRAQKAEFVAELNRTFNEVGVVVVTRNLGMTVKQSTDLRNRMRDAGATYKVSKNKLAKIALDGTDYLSLGELLVGPIGLATSADPVAAAKVAIDFAKTNDKFEIVGGAMGTQVLDANGIKSLASLPSLDELRAKIVGLLVAPATKLATITQAPAAQLARVLSAYAEKEAA